MRFKPTYFVLFFTLFVFSTKAQEVINDAGCRLGLGVEKKINNQLTLKAKFMTRQVENFTLLNRIYLRGEVSYKLHKHFEAGAKFYYMQKQKRFDQGFSPSYRYAFSLIYKLNLTSRFSLSNRLTYQISNNTFIPNDFLEEKSTTVLRDKLTLKFKHTRRGTAYIEDEGLFQLFGKNERYYFGRNRVYIGYNYQLTQQLEFNPYFILERTYGTGSKEPHQRTFYYCLELSYSF